MQSMTSGSRTQTSPSTSRRRRKRKRRRRTRHRPSLVRTLAAHVNPQPTSSPPPSLTPEKAKQQRELELKKQEQRNQQEKKETTVEKKKLEAKAEQKTESKEEKKVLAAKVEEKKVAVKVDAGKSEASKQTSAKVEEKTEVRKTSVSKQQSTELSTSAKSTSSASATSTSATTTSAVSATKVEDKKTQSVKQVEESKAVEKKEAKQEIKAAAKQSTTETKTAEATKTAAKTTATASAKSEEQKVEGKKATVQQKAAEKTEVRKTSVQQEKQVSAQRQESRGSIDEPAEGPAVSLDKKASLVPQIQVEKDKSPAPGDEKRGSTGKATTLLNEPESRRGSSSPGSRRGSFLLDGAKEGEGLLGAQLKKAPARRGSDVRRGSTAEDDPAEKPSIPLVACPGPAPKILDFQVNQSATEGKTAVILFSVTGDPVPTFQFFKDEIEIFEGGRYKVVTDGSAKNVISFCIRKSKVNDEGKYKIIAKNEHGQDTAEIALFVGGEEGMDFRALLKKGKKAPKKKEEDPDFGSLKSTESERKASIKEMKVRSFRSLT